MLKFCTFNILADYATKYHTENCEDYDGMLNDNIFRYNTILNILLKNDYDVIFLQEVGMSFSKLKQINKLFEIYHIIIKNDLYTCLKKSKFGKAEKTNFDIIDKYVFGIQYNEKVETTLKQILYVTGTLFNGEKIHFINTHLLPGINTNDNTIPDGIKSAKTLIDQYLKEITRYDNNIIISGDMNIGIDLEFYRMTKIKSLQGTTSVSLKTCGNKYNPFKEINYKELDHIYVSENIKLKSSIQYDDFNKEKYNLLWAGSFYSYVPPFVPVNVDNAKKNWVFKKYEDMYNTNEYNKKWPSDHILLEFELELMGLSSYSNEFIPQLNTNANEFIPQLNTKANEFIPQLNTKSNEFIPQLNIKSNEFIPQLNTKSNEFIPQQQLYLPQQQLYSPQQQSYLQQQSYPPNQHSYVSQRGGNNKDYYAKYIKYKAKYLALK